MVHQPQVVTGAHEILLDLKSLMVHFNSQSDQFIILNSILKERVKLGVDVDMAIIKSGIGYSAESTLRLADIYTFYK